MIAHKRSEWEKASLTMEEKREAFMGAHHADEVEALMYLMGDGRHENDVMMVSRTPEEVAELKNRMRQQKKQQLMARGVNETDATAMADKFAKKFGGQYYDKVEWPEFLKKKLMHGGISEEEAVARIAHLQEFYEGEQKGRGVGMVVSDDDGQFRLSNDLSYYDKFSSPEQRGMLLEKLNDLKIFEADRDSEGNITKLKFVMRDK
jgi:uncharacterized protein YoaH (UPF0181 family)